MADSLSVSSVRDPYSFVTRFVKSIEGGIHSNSFSKCGKRQSEKLIRFVDVAATKDLKLLVSILPPAAASSKSCNSVFRERMLQMHDVERGRMWHSIRPN